MDDNLMVDGIFDPTTEEIIAKDDVDGLIGAYERLYTRENTTRQARINIANLLAMRAVSETGTKTVRVRGERRRVKIELPDDSWDQGRLQEAWYAYPDLRDEFLTIATLRVRLVEYKKMLNERGTEPFENFKAMVQAANRGPQGVPRIIIET